MLVFLKTFVNKFGFTVSLVLKTNKQSTVSLKLHNTKLFLTESYFQNDCTNL